MFHVTYPNPDKTLTVVGGPFETYKQAAACARVESKKQARTMQIMRQEPGTPRGTPELELPTPTVGLAELYDQLERHDWYYTYSDDHRVWKRGEAERARLNDLADSIPGGAELMDAYYKYMFSGEAWGNEQAAKPARPTTGRAAAEELAS